MVLHTSGYGVYFTRTFRSEPTFLLAGNQISVEQRFFTPSRPAPADWSKLTIWQAATDHHRIVAALKPIYTGRWISTGESKGGMTSVYHRRFYPSDVDGIVAYVAPNDVVDAEDAYTRFLNNVGTNPACRTALASLQRESLRRRAEIVGRFEAWARDNSRTFNRFLGTAPGLFAARSYVPRDIPMSFDTAAMPDIDAWVRQQGSRLLFVYGQNDPWSAEPFRLGPGSRDSFWYEVSGGNHGADLADLAAAQRSAATATVRRWAGLTPAGTAAGRFLPGLDDWQPRLERRAR